MTPEQQSALIHSQAVAAQIKMYSMLTKNKQCEDEGKTATYNESHFADLEGEFGIGCNSVIHFFNS